MIRAGAVVLALAGPAAADGFADQALCTAVWAKLSGEVGKVFPITGTLAPMDGEWCVIEAPVVDLAGEYVPDWYADRLRFRGSALAFALDGFGSPDRLVIAVEGLRLVVQTGTPQMDWLFAAQARANTIDANLALGWDKSAKSLSIEALTIDFPGANLVELSARASGVDIASPGAAQMSVTSFAVTEADLRIRTHGLFEWYVLMPFGPNFLPYEGDIDAAALRLKADMAEAVASLPGATFSAPSKDALRALIAELPNPSGDLTVAFRADPGFGPTRVMGYAVTGVPDSLSEAEALFQGVTVDIGWSHQDAP